MDKAKESKDNKDEKLLRECEEAFTRLDREIGLDEEYLELLAALRIRLFGAQRKTLDEVMKAAGEMRGKVKLEDIEAPKPQGSLDSLLGQEPKPKEWPT